MTSEKPTTEARRKVLRLAIIELSMGVFVIAGFTPAMLFSAHIYGYAFSLDLDGALPLKHTLWLLGILLISIVVGSCLGAFIWLVFSRFVFRFAREDVRRFIRTPWVQFDEWLVQQVYSERGASGEDRAI